MFGKNRVPGDAHDAPKPIRVRVPIFHLPNWLYIPWLVLKGVGWAIYWAVVALVYAAKFYWLSVPAGLLGYLTAVYGWHWAAAAAVFVTGMLLVWWWRHRASFRRW